MNEQNRVGLHVWLMVASPDDFSHSGSLVRIMLITSIDSCLYIKKKKRKKIYTFDTHH